MRCHRGLQVQQEMKSAAVMLDPTECQNAFMLNKSSLYCANNAGSLVRTPQTNADCTCSISSSRWLLDMVPCDSQRGTTMFHYDITIASVQSEGSGDGCRLSSHIKVIFKRSIKSCSYWLLASCLSK